MTKESDMELIPLETAAALVGVSVTTLRRHAATLHTLEAKKIGRNWATTERAVRAWQANPELHKRGPKQR